MNKLRIFSLFFILLSCSTPQESKISCNFLTDLAIKCADAELKPQLFDLKSKGIDGFVYSSEIFLITPLPMTPRTG